MGLWFKRTLNPYFKIYSEFQDAPLSKVVEYIFLSNFHFGVMAWNYFEFCSKFDLNALSFENKMKNQFLCLTGRAPPFSAQATSLAQAHTRLPAARTHAASRLAPARARHVERVHRRRGAVVRS
jgi:hypothetical protein